MINPSMYVYQQCQRGLIQPYIGLGRLSIHFYDKLQYRAYKIQITSDLVLNIMSQLTIGRLVGSVIYHALSGSGSESTNILRLRLDFVR